MGWDDLILALVLLGMVVTGAWIVYYVFARLGE